MSSSSSAAPSPGTRRISLPWPTSASASSSRQRTASRASVAPSTVTADATGTSPQLTLEQKAASRQTLSRHLSQSQLGVAASSTSTSAIAAGRASGRRTSVASTTASVSTKSYANANVTPAQSVVATTNYLETLSTSPSSIRFQRRRSSGAPSVSGERSSLSRSPSWMASAGRKSSLSVPQLSVIEGSIGDLRTQEPQTIPDNAPYTISESPSAVQSEVEKAEAGQDTMKRRRSQQEAEDTEGRLKKRSSTTLRTDEPADISHASRSIEQSQAPAEGSREVSQARSVSSQGWKSYLTLPRGSKPPGKQSEPEPRPLAVPADDTTLPRATSEEGEDTLRATSPKPIAASASEQTAQSRDMAPTSSRRSYLNLRLFAAGEVPEEAKSAPVSRPASIKAIDAPAVIPAPARDPSDSAEKAVAEAAPTQSAQGEEPVRLNEHDAAPAARDVRSAAPRPTSWWPFYGSVNAEPTPVLVAEPAEVMQAVGVADAPAAMEIDQPRTAVAETISGPENVPIASGEAPPTAIVEPLPPQVEPEGWGTWLGSYLSRPAAPAAATTTVTYGAGLVPSNASTISAASSVAPEADETLPDIPTEAAEPSTPGTEIHMNPLLSTLPASSWSIFFSSASRARVYPTSARKAVTQRATAEEPESMEIDFSEMTPGGPATSSATAKPVKVSSAMERIKGDSSRPSSVRSLPVTKTASAAGKEPSSGGQSVSLSHATGSSSTAASGSGSRPIKPLTSDKKAARGTSTTPATKKAAAPPKPNLILPSFEDTFHCAPRSLAPALPAPSVSSSGTGSIKGRSVSSPPSMMKKAVAASFGYLFSSPISSPSPPPAQAESRKGKEREILSDKVERLPKALSVLGEKPDLAVSGTAKVVCIGIHGWFIQSYLKNVVGEPTGTSSKFASMMASAVKSFYAAQGCSLNDEAILSIPLEGDGTVVHRLDALYQALFAREDWVAALNSASRIFVASHSQGTIVAAMLVSRLINDGEVNGTKVAMLNMCSVSQGPFVSLYNSWTVPAYLYFETKAATELFEFQKPESAASKVYLECMQHILNAGVKVLFIASLNDQVVPLYSALFSSLSHPNILRAIFIDAQAFETSADFMTNLVVFSTRLRNAGLSPHGMDFHLSEALAGSLMGVGHSTVYDEPQVYSLAVRYLLETSGPLPVPVKQGEEPSPLIEVEPFNPRVPANSYFLPWALRGIIEDQQIRTFFSKELQELRDQFERWDPKTSALKQVKNALEPLRFLPRSTLSVPEESVQESAETGKDPGKKAAKPTAKL